MEHSSEFFRPGHLYVPANLCLAPEVAPIFRCVAVAEHPRKKEARAFGFAALALDLRWSSVAYSEREWAKGWIDLGPAPEQDEELEQSADPAEVPEESAEDKGEDVIARGTLVAYRGSITKLHGKYRSEQCGCRRCADVMDGPRYLLRDRATDEVVVRCARRRSVSPVF